jgi:hypothetical protein
MLFLLVWLDLMRVSVILQLLRAIAFCQIPPISMRRPAGQGQASMRFADRVHFHCRAMPPAKAIFTLLRVIAGSAMMALFSVDQ